MSSCCAGSKTLVFACSGGSNVGQLSNEAAKQLDMEGVGSFFCAAGIGGGLAGFITKAREADATIVIDGCDLGCVKAAFEREDVPISKYVVITDLGIEKGHHFNLTDEQVATVCAAAKKSCCCG
ncbi:putative zinc-binding protein [bacterium]|nr:putative zinc-binding protein [bacterium]